MVRVDKLITLRVLRCDYSEHLSDAHIIRSWDLLVTSDGCELPDSECVLLHTPGAITATFRDIDYYVRYNYAGRLHMFREDLPGVDLEQVGVNYKPPAVQPRTFHDYMKRK